MAANPLTKIGGLHLFVDNVLVGVLGVEALFAEVAVEANFDAGELIFVDPVPPHRWTLSWFMRSRYRFASDVVSSFPWSILAARNRPSAHNASWASSCRMGSRTASTIDYYL